VEWLMAAADAIDKIEAELIRSLIRVIGKPKHGLSGVELGGVRRSSQGCDQGGAHHGQYRDPWPGH
jgi:hypothetical protein